jgi:transcription elongation factor GreB
VISNHGLDGHRMSRAFVSESDTDNEHELPPLTSPLPPGARNYMTPAGAAKLRAEVDELREGKHSELAAIVARMRAPGANVNASELKTAQHDLAIVDRQLKYLEELMGTAEVVSRQSGPADKVAFGMTVDVIAGEEVSYTIVGIYESDPDNGFISWISPIARAIMGKRIGDEVEIVLPAVTRKMKIVSIRQS